MIIIHVVHPWTFVSLFIPTFAFHSILPPGSSAAQTLILIIAHLFFLKVEQESQEVEGNGRMILKMDHKLYHNIPVIPYTLLQQLAGYENRYKWALVVWSTPVCALFLPPHQSDACHPRQAHVFSPSENLLRWRNIQPKRETFSSPLHLRDGSWF